MVRVQVTEGILEGEILENVLGGKYYSFKGIPYAAPPVGELRFKAPQPPKPWSGIREAKQHGPICHQIHVFTKEVRKGSEDCLYLNIYTRDLSYSKLLPVMVWIHGGGYVSNSGNSDEFGPDFLVDKGVVLVTFNYRLEILGFLCLDTKDVPGNAGMKDQVAALQWVNNNIRNFGGDPDNITIFGESVGGASVAYHLISPMTKGLFNRAIAQSGTILNNWSQTFGARMRAEALARQLGNDTTDDNELYVFFKKLPIDKLIGVRAPITADEDATLQVNLFFSVVDEKQFDGNERFFHGDVYEKLRQGIHEGVEVMLGCTTHEGILNFCLIPDLIHKYNSLYQCYVPSPMAIECSVKDQLEAGKRIKIFYCGNQSISAENLDKLVAYFTLHFTLYDSLLWARICYKSNKNKLYFYNFDGDSERNIFTDKFYRCNYVLENKRRVAHCDDLQYIFNNDLIPLDKKSISCKIIDNMTKLWTNFAKFGNPTPDDCLGTVWPPFDNKQQKYLNIREYLEVKSHLRKEDVELWDTIYRQYLPSKYHV